MGRIATAQKDLTFLGVNANNEQVIFSDVQKFSSFSFGIHWSGNTGGGTYKAQASLKKNPQSSADWFDVPNMDAVVTGASGIETLHFDLSKGNFTKLKLVYTHGSGQHDATISIAGKYEA